MMITKQLISKYLYIEDYHINNFINTENIGFIKLDFGYDKLNKYIYAVAASEKEKPNKKIFKITENREQYRFRAPSFLLKYKGKKVAIYRDFIKSDKNELFRITPVDFSFSSKKLNVRSEPYFTKGGIIVIPSLYINNYLDEWSYLIRLSFNKTCDFTLDKGEICAEFTTIKDSRKWNYPLYQYNSGMRSRTLLDFINFVNLNGKFLEKFYYEGTYEDKHNKYGSVLFKEVL